MGITYIGIYGKISYFDYGYELDRSKGRWQGKRIPGDGVAGSKAAIYGESEYNSFEKVKEFLDGTIKYIKQKESSGK